MKVSLFLFSLLAVLLISMFILSQDYYTCSTLDNADESMMPFFEEVQIVKSGLFVCTKRHVSSRHTDSLYNEYIIFPHKYHKGNFLIDKQNSVFYFIKALRHFCVSKATSGKISMDGFYYKKIDFYSMKMQLLKSSRNNEKNNCSKLTGFDFR